VTRTYTIVASDVYAGQLCSNFISYIDAISAVEAKDIFLAREESRERKYSVHAVFLGRQVEMLSSYQEETMFLGHHQPKTLT